MVAFDERTPLRKAEGGGPPYMFMQNPNKLYRKQIHQFQLLICVTFLLLFLTAVTISLLQMVKDDTIDNNPDNSSSVTPLLLNTWPIADKGPVNWEGSEPKQDVIHQALSAAQMSLAKKDELEANMIGVPPGTPSYKHQLSVKTSLRATYLARTGYMMDVATKNVIKSTGKTEADKNPKTSVGVTSSIKSPLLPEDVCGKDVIEIACLDSPYRTADGSCNNLKNPYTWGVAMQPFRRALPPDYADGVSAPRKAVDGSELPSAREVSVTVHRPEYRDDEKFTVMLAVWGQFLDHDISATALSQGKDGGTISCCGKSEAEMHPECFPVTVKPDDPYFKNITCLEFVRSAPAPKCTLGPRDQLNQASSYIDGSVVYGNNDETISSLRSYENGALRMTITPDGRTLLPISTDPNDGCNKEEENAKGRYCFASGDPRANENVPLTSMHLILARQHNSIAAQLSAINPNWDDEKLFQESRKIVSAQMQYITYNEFLPILLGSKIMDKLDLLPNEKDASSYSSYDPNINPSVSNNFATAAFRFAHTLLPGMMKVMKNMTSEEKVELHQLLFDPYKLYSPGFLDSTVRGAMNTPLERLDNYFSKQVTEKLFKQPEKPCGLDLVSLNIQRGRDHGLASYPAWREHCGLSRPSAFTDLEGYVDGDSLTRMSSLYKSVDDIDLYTGALSEFPLEGAMLGPTLTCLIGDQFKRLKDGDRYWYESQQQPQPFTADQLREIRKTSLASVICNTADALDAVSPKVMQAKSLDNPLVPCTQIPQPDFTIWSDIFPSTSQNKLVQTPAFGAITSAVFGLQVTKVSLISDDGSQWSGTPPVNVPLSLFNKAPSIVPTRVLPSSVQWTITSVNESPDKLTLSGSYSVVTYAFMKPGIFNYTAKQLSGTFSFDANLLWNNTDISTVLLNDVNYSSLLFFSTVHPPKNISVNKDIVKQPLQFVLVNPPKIKKLSGSFVSGVGKKVSRSSIIVLGNYSLDQTTFNWLGNITVTLPIGNPLLSKPINVNEPVLSDSISNKLNKTRIVFNISGGSIENDFTDGSQKSLWNGELPFTIPLIDSTTGLPIPPKYSAIFSVSEVTPNLKGSFSVPKFIHGFGFNISWTNGKFNLIANTLLNESMDTVLKPGFKYYAKIIFNEVKDVPLKSTPDVNGNQLEEFVDEGLDAIDSVIPVSIVLQGVYTPARTAFIWSGQGIISVKSVLTKMMENYEKQTVDLNNPEISEPLWNKNRFGGTVSGGHVTVNTGGFFNFGNTVWSGGFPVGIPVSYLGSGNFSSYTFSLGISWSGNLLGNTVEGKFSLPQFTGDWLPYPSVQWVSGTFSFGITPIWNTTLQDVFLPGANYYSKISLQGLKTSNVDDLPSAILSDVNPSLSAPIILQGTYSPDRTLFFWSGSFIIAFRNGFTVTADNLQLQKILNNEMLSNVMISKTNAVVSVKSIDLSANPVTPTLNQKPIIWSGSAPVTLPIGKLIKNGDGSYADLDIVWTGEITENNVIGTFDSIIYPDNNGTKTVWNGKFSFDYVSKLNTSLSTVIKSGGKYSVKLFFKESELPTIDSVLLTAVDNIVEQSKFGAVILFGSFSSKPFYCPSFICEDKVFYWSGDAVINLPKKSTFLLTAPSKVVKDKVKPKPYAGKPAAGKPSAGKSFPGKPFAAKISSGSVNVNSDNETTMSIWSGSFPVSFPVDAIKNINENGYCLVWSGSLTGTIFQGNFSFPVVTKTGTETDVEWFDGEFKFNVTALWFTSLDGGIISGRKYCSGIYFQSNTTSSKNKTIVPLLEATVNGSFPASIILKGNYSIDESLFYWNGPLIVSFKNASAVKDSQLKFTLESEKIGDDVTTKPLKPTRAPKPTKAPKPPKPIKQSISFSIISGSIYGAMDGSNSTQLWNGDLPVDLKLDNVLQEGAFSPMAQVSWSGSATDTDFEGTFNMPVNVVNGTTKSTKNWIGNFSLQFQTKWSANLEAFIDSKRLYNCRVLFNEFNKKSSLLSSSAQDNDILLQQMMKDSENIPTDCNLLIIGTFYKKPFYCSVLSFLCTDETIFTWSGEVIFTVILPTAPDVPAVTNLKMSNIINGNGTIRKIIGKAISGSLSAGVSGGSESILWSGEIPAVIPLPVFWAPVTDAGPPLTNEDKVYGHGAIWSGSVFGTTIHGRFSLPQYTWNGAISSIRWWNGDFSAQVMSLWDMGIGNLITPGINFYSRVIFRDIKNATNLLEASSPTQYEINSAYKAPLILLGNYSKDGKTFYWYGNFIIVFHNVPDTNLYSY